jgi:signal transduction histidine kinase
MADDPPDDARLLHVEKMAALGKLSAGLAHELNNPAAAAARSASQLRESLLALQGLVLESDRAFTDGERREMALVQKAALAHREGERSLDPPLEPIAQSDLEDELTEWLEARHAEDSWRLAPTFAASGLDTGWLDEIAGRIGDESVLRILPWMEGMLNVADLLDQVEQSTARISELVTAIKQYSYMGQAPQLEVDLHEGLENTLKILAFKLRKANVEVVREFDRNLPKVCVFGGEISQVWTNLIDNAIDAMKANGRGILTLRTAFHRGAPGDRGDEAVVDIVDDGPGIPEDVQSHLFEPFYTTKGVGEGSGLGLDIARRIVRTRHKGEIRFESRPGQTRFEVRLPIPC